MQRQTKYTPGDRQIGELQPAVCAREGGIVQPLWGAWEITKCALQNFASSGRMTV